MKKISKILWLVFLIFTITACSSSGVGSVVVGSSSQTITDSGAETDTVDSSPSTVAGASSPITVEYDSDDLDAEVDGSEMSYIKLGGDSIAFEGSGATVDGTVVTIASAGSYSVSGTLDDGQIIVDSTDPETVVLVLSGVDISSSTSAPIYVRNAEKTIITLAEGTENYISDATSYLFEEGEDEPNAAVFSKDDLTINGSGSLVVEANYNNGIASKDDLKIVSGRITVTAVNDGIKGRDSIAVKDGMITLNTGGDGMQSNNDEESTKGYIVIEGGTLNIVADLDGIQAETSLSISGGNITITAGGGSVELSNNANLDNRGMENNSVVTSSISTKGMKAGVDLTIAGGSIQIDSLDDALHSNDSMTLDGGDLVLATSDDGMHADSSLTINGGEVTITRSYEGIESQVITINEGNIHLVSSDDGINASSGTGGAAGGGPGQGFFESGDNYLYINGGYIVVDALGDGLDINGPIEMTDGTILVTGPVSNGNGALDYAGSFDISGGLLVAVGSAGMAEAPSSSSSQYSIIHNYTSVQSAGTVIRIESEDGSGLLTFEPTREYQSVVFSSPDLQNGETYVVYAGGSSTGEFKDGLYWGGEYTPGTQVSSFTISSMVTATGNATGGFTGGGGGVPGGARPPGPGG